ncbi:MAG: orotate phosphoribosyltransferase [Thiohalocapsa sp.]|jgi:orotate phosphoribosyltransferase|uniref:orotate phosphoribosyltransferase n=1 Tax=Thiohalocapsa sp. TaxID=2497641 RepID=UPI0025D16696|nr:orotate phosphoribosyltransferase [Thiohalocapsa sp.]MCG6941895.1 orotate phosphoribosyltransferase [Thiohalocapsa sp.]
MQDYQRDFLRFAVDTGVLRFGQFTLKSGRQSPYFFNAGAFSTGLGLARLGRFYAAALMRSGLDVDMLFGPAYKGIPLAACTAIALAEHHDRDMPFAFNRKESKDHGEGGSLVGSELKGRVLIVDDVITAGTSVRESVTLIRGAGATPVGVLIALDRCERGSGAGSATAEIAAEHGLATISIATLHDLVDFLKGHGVYADFHPALADYRSRYGAT